MSEIVAQRHVGPDLAGEVRPDQVEGQRPDEGVVGVADTGAEDRCALEDLAELLEVVDVRGRSEEVVVVEEAVAAVDRGDGDHVPEHMGVGEADERDLVVEIASGLVAADDVAVDQRHVIAEDRTVVERQDEGQARSGRQDAGHFRLDSAEVGVAAERTLQEIAELPVEGEAPRGEIRLVAAVHLGVDEGADVHFLSP